MLISTAMGLQRLYFKDACAVGAAVDGAHEERQHVLCECVCFICEERTMLLSVSFRCDVCVFMMRVWVQVRMCWMHIRNACCVCVLALSFALCWLCGVCLFCVSAGVFRELCCAAQRGCR